MGAFMMVFDLLAAYLVVATFCACRAVDSCRCLRCNLEVVVALVINVVEVVHGREAVQMFPLARKEIVMRAGSSQVALRLLFALALIVTSALAFPHPLFDNEARIVTGGDFLEKSCKLTVFHKERRRGIVTAVHDNKER